MLRMRSQVNPEFLKIKYFQNGRVIPILTLLYLPPVAQCSYHSQQFLGASTTIGLETDSD